jgi:cyclase
MDRDGTKDGYDTDLLHAISSAVDVPVIASGGAGEPDHLVDAFNAGADAVLLASILHYGQYTVAELKRHLAAAGVSVRAPSA